METERRPDRVEVPRWVLLGLASLAVISLLGFAFLLGRESNRAEVAPARAPSLALDTREETPRLTPAPLPTEAAPLPTTIAPEPPTYAPPPPPLPAPQAPTAQPPPAPPRPPVDPVVRTKVAHYFQALEASVGIAEAWQDPRAMASNVLEQGAQGDFAGFDTLLQANHEALARVRAIQAPAPCAEHHRLTIQTMVAGIELLQRLKKATQHGDSSALVSLAMEGQQLQTRIQHLERMAAQCKSRYGL